MAKKKSTAKSASVPIDVHKHVADKRPNIPTRETAAFAADDGPQPFVVHRDRSLDPQLVWKGKDEQDARPLEVPAVHIHVQEKIHPQAIVEDVKAWTVSPTQKRGQRQLDLFADFNGLDDFGKKLEFYQHDQHWTNRLILGDSLLVMASLAERERLRGQVQCIYFDPPYGIKFGSNWQVSTRKRDVKDAKAEDLTRQPEQIKAFRDTWELGIHSYLTYLRDRLAVARELLTESGSIFVQIGDENVHLVRCLLDELFGSENFISNISFVTTHAKPTNFLSSLNDNLLWYSKNREICKYRQLYLEKELREGGGWAHNSAELHDGTRIRPGVEKVKAMLEQGEALRPYSLTTLSAQGASSKPDEDWFEFKGKRYHPGQNYHWKTTSVGMLRLAWANRIEASQNTIRHVRFIDKAIARHADTETLYDQPYEDKGVVRVTGPFTVESLSPHRSLPLARRASEGGGDDPSDDPSLARRANDPPSLLRRGNGPGFLAMILGNLRKAGVKGTDKRQRIAFARLDPFPGEHIQAEGETDAGAAVRVCVGPEFGTLGDADIKRAALEAVKGSGCDLLLVCAFAFEASVHEQTAELTKEIKFGKLAVLPVRMNPDLAMGDELLKKTGAGHLFTVFGEPDVKLQTKGSKVVVTIRGVDVFDPSTGAVRTGETDDIACWFIDTDYDGQSFFVRHAYFLHGGKDTPEGPYDKLKKALRAEIDEAEWSKLYRATSQPFDPPKSGKIAVKVINHFGDEVLKVFRAP